MFQMNLGLPFSAFDLQLWEISSPYFSCWSSAAFMKANEDNISIKIKIGVFKFYGAGLEANATRTNQSLKNWNFK